MTTRRAAHDRESGLTALRTQTFDVLVIGGGITGCGIAHDAALRGLSVALVEKDDFASGTSSRSSRLVHGGLRYLEHGYLHLVWEASAERRTLLRIVPHLVRPLAFVWPVYSGARISRWKLAAGLTLYDALAMFGNVAPHHSLSAAGVAEAEPALQREGLRGGARYFDAATNDARLTLANALAAVDAGAVVMNRMRVMSLVQSAGVVAGAVVQDVLDGSEFQVTARTVVNATGPWSDDVRSMSRDRGAPAAESRVVRGSKGVHIAIPRERVGNHGALTLLSPTDGRVMFILPASTQTIVGTTDTYTDSSPDEVRASEADVQYLLDAANRFFPDAGLTRDDVVSAWAGIRPLVANAGATPAAASREHAVAVGPRGLVSITGGKLTTYRVMASQVVDAVQRELGGRVSRSRTKSRLLPGGDITSLAEAITAAQQATGDAAMGRHLASNYGSAWRDVWEEISSTADGAMRLEESLPYTVGEMRWCVQREMALGLGDLFIRRTHLAFETRDHGASAAPTVAAAIAPLLGWTKADATRALADYVRESARVFKIESAE